MRIVARFACVLLLLGVVAGCDRAPDADATRAVLQQRLAAALKPPVTEVVSFRRLGSGPLPAGPDGRARRIVYYNAVLKLTQDVDFTSWNGLNAVAFAALLGATERGVIGIRQDGNRSGDELKVHGSATFIDENGIWQAVPWIAPNVGIASPEDNTAPPSEAKRLLDQIHTTLDDGSGSRQQRAAIVAEELAKSAAAIRLRLDRLDRRLVLAGGQEGGEYAEVAGLIAGAISGHGLAAQAVASDGSWDSVRLLREGLAEVALVQNDVAGAAARGEGAVALDAALPDLRALGSLFPEPVQIVVAAGSPIAAIADLKGKRVDIGQPGSGTRANAEAVLAASGVAVRDLGEAKELGLAQGLQMLAAGEIDAVITTLAAPAHSLQLAAGGPGIRLLSIGTQERAILTGGRRDFVPVTLPPNTYPGQAEDVETVAVTALLVGTTGLADSTVETLLQEVYGGIDFVAAGSAAGALISKATGRTGLTLPLHPAAERFLLRDAPSQ